MNEMFPAELPHFRSNSAIFLGSQIDVMSNISDLGFRRLSYLLEEPILLETPLRAQNYISSKTTILFY